MCLKGNVGMAPAVHYGRKKRKKTWPHQEGLNIFWGVNKIQAYKIMVYLRVHEVIAKLGSPKNINI